MPGSHLLPISDYFTDLLTSSSFKTDPYRISALDVTGKAQAEKEVKTEADGNLIQVLFFAPYLKEAELGRGEKRSALSRVVFSHSGSTRVDVIRHRRFLNVVRLASTGGISDLSSYVADTYARI